MNEEQHTIKTVPIYYGNEIIGSAEIETIKNRYIEELTRTLDVLTFGIIKINPEFKQMFLHMWDYHHVRLNTYINKILFESIQQRLEELEKIRRT